MIGDMETEVDMLRRQCSNAWSNVGAAEGGNVVNLFLAVVMTLCFASVWTWGPNIWIGVVASFSWMMTAVFQPFIQSHFSKKYMRLENGE